jgi:hypothetical protein
MGIALVASAEPVRPDADLAAEPDTSTQSGGGAVDGVLLLHDGGVLAGRISRRADRYLVTLDHGEISVSASQVALTARSLDDAYDQQRRLMSRPTAEAHLRLAEWCLRNNLGPQAAQGLVDARGLDPRDPKLTLLERRLAALSAVGSRQKTLPAEAKSSDAMPDNELERLGGLADSLPAGTLEQFTRKVQPVLVNSCTTAGCHEAGGAQTFQLDRAVLHGLSNRRSTLRNLEATLALVDRDVPQQSGLLTVPRRIHGGMAQPVLGPRQDQLFKHLNDWVTMVTGSDSPADAVLAAAPTTPGSTYSRPSGRLVEPIRRVPYEVDPAEAAAGRSAGRGVVTASHVTATPAEQRVPVVRYGAQIVPSRPEDPFDPEVFNRQSDARSRAIAPDQDAALPANR